MKLSMEQIEKEMKIIADSGYGGILVPTRRKPQLEVT